MSEQVRAGTLKLADFFEAESCMHRSHGHCMTMGTASTMASMVEALGIGLPGNAAYPAVDGRRNVLARWPAGASSRWCMPTRPCPGADARGLRERHPHAGGHRRQHQCGDPPDRHRRPPGREAHGGRLRPPGQRAALPGQPAAQRPVPDGGLLLRRRPARGDEGDRAPAAPGRVTVSGKTVGENIADAQNFNPTSSAASTSPSRTRPASPCCAATWRRAAR
jgi:hypothetical protein